MRKPRTFTVNVLKHRLIMPEIFYKQNLGIHVPRTKICPTRGLMAWFRREQEQRMKKHGIAHAVAALSRDTSYYYYRCGGERDTGWGCAYRCVQMMLDCVQRVLATAGCKCRGGQLSASTFVASVVKHFQMPSIRDMQVRRP